MLYATGLFLAFWLGTLISAVITSKLVKNQRKYEDQTQINTLKLAAVYANEAEIFIDDRLDSYKSKYPYDWELDEKFFQTIKHFKKN